MISLVLLLFDTVALVCPLGEHWMKMMVGEGAFRPLQKLPKWNLTLPGNFPGLCRQGGHIGEKLFF